MNHKNIAFLVNKFPEVLRNLDDINEPESDASKYKACIKLGTQKLVNFLQFSKTDHPNNCVIAKNQYNQCLQVCPEIYISRIVRYQKQ